MDFIRTNKRYFITIIVGLVMAAIMCFSRDILSAEGTMVYHILSDAFAVPGLFILAAGILVMVSNEGLFNGISYGIKAVTKALTNRREPKMEESFYEYHTRKSGQERIRFGHLLIVGVVFVVISVILAMFS